jgi:opacity protein-like surface antigen
MMTRRLLMILFAALAMAAPAAAQDDDPDRDPNAAQPDFYVATLNTTLRLPHHKMNFRLTHRFTTALGQGDFGDLAGRLFGLDGGALVGLDLKYGLLPGFDIGIYRTSLDRTIQFQGRYNVIKDGSGPLGLSVVANVDGTDNFTDEYSPGVALVLSRELGDRGAFYLQPSYVGNSNLVNDVDDDYTAMVGVGARVRFGRNSYLFAEVSPRVAGFDPGVNMASFGFEQRYGGHVFQLNFSNHFGTTLAQVARGGSGSDNWYLGFNLARKFF